MQLHPPKKTSNNRQSSFTKSSKKIWSRLDFKRLVGIRVCRHDVDRSQYTCGRQQLDTVELISSGPAYLTTSLASCDSPFSFYSSCGSSTSSRLTSKCPRLMTLGQTRRWCNGVTHGAPQYTHGDTHTHTHALTHHVVSPGSPG